MSQKFSIGHTLVGSTNVAINVAKQQGTVDLMVVEENENLVKLKEQEKCDMKVALAPALISSGKLATDVVDEASRFVPNKVSEPNVAFAST